MFDRPVAGHEWYATEHDPSGRPFRWSGPLTRSTVTLDVDTRADLEVELRVLDAIAPDVLEGLRLEVHGESIPLRPEAPVGGGRRFCGLIPQRCRGRGRPASRRARSARAAHRRPRATSAGGAATRDRSESRSPGLRCVARARASSSNSLARAGSARAAS